MEEGRSPMLENPNQSYSLLYYAFWFEFHLLKFDHSLGKNACILV